MSRNQNPFPQKPTFTMPPMPKPEIKKVAKIKLSELCREHIKRTIDEDWFWVDSVVIQRDEDGYQTLVYFKSTKQVTFSEDEKKEGYEDDVYEVIQVVWFDKKGKITMIDG